VNPERARRFEPLLIVLALAIVAGFFTNLGAIPLFDLDEGAFSEATRELFERHDFLITTLNGEPRYDKPILFYWLQALSVSWLGWNEFALRLPSAIAATAWALATTAFVTRVRDLRTGCVAGIVLATSLLISLIGKSAISDATLNCFLAASMFSVYLYFLEARRRYVIRCLRLHGSRLPDQGSGRDPDTWRRQPDLLRFVRPMADLAAGHLGSYRLADPARHQPALVSDGLLP